MFKKKKIPQKLRISVLNRDNNKCLWCGRSSIEGVTLDVDHILAEHWGGKTTYENLGVLCSHCNRSKGSDYLGSYLLSTRFKVKNFEKWLENKLIGHNINGDGDSYKYEITFCNNKGGIFLKSLS